MWRLVLAGAAAGGMGWGIRGQYGHETGAMIAGVLVSLVVVALLRPHAPAAWALRAVAFGAIGVGFGGAMTYGQTIGLTQDAALIGNWPALRWGLIGLSIKGAAWIGWFGACLAIGLGSVRYRARELFLLMLALVGVSLLGIWLLNEPYEPANRLLPRLYFSASWAWRPDVVDLQPRREVWGGLLVSLGVVSAYASRVRGDSLTPRLVGWGLLGGAIGFPLGQCLQAFHAWNPEVFTHGASPSLHVNWWNAMETTFGAVMGAAIAFGTWRHRHLVATPDARGASEATADGAPSWWWAAKVGLVMHVGVLLIAEFTDMPTLGRYIDITLLMGVLPLAAAAQDRWAAALLALPVTMAPIAGKTVKRLVYEQHAAATAIGWLAYAVIPLAAAVALAWWALRRVERGDGLPTRVALVFTAWTYFFLNFAFFRYPWPWAPWTNRTPHALVFLACAIVVTAAVTAPSRRPSGGFRQ